MRARRENNIGIVLLFPFFSFFFSSYFLVKLFFRKFLNHEIAESCVGSYKCARENCLHPQSGFYDREEGGYVGIKF